MKAAPCLAAAAALALAAPACKKADSAPGPASATQGAPGALKVGLVTDVGGRGDQSFNDGALRGLEMWAGGKRYTAKGYRPLSAAELQESIPDDVRRSVAIRPLEAEPVILQAKQQEDYEPNLQVLVDDGVRLAIGVGFMLENAIEATARRNPAARFLLIDSPLLDAKGVPISLPNVRTVTFREHEATFLVGAVAGLVTKSGVVGFVGGMQIPLIRKFEAGFRAGVATTNPEAGRKLLAAYTGSFDRVEAGKQVAQDMIAKGADVLFHAAGSDGLGAIAAAKEAGRFAIGCDSDQAHLAPQTIATSFIKHVDLAVYRAVEEVREGKFTAGHEELGLKEGGVGIAPFRMSAERMPEREKIAAKVEALQKAVIEGTIRVPATMEELAAFKAAEMAR
jgi:basic membrane protein A